MIYVVSCHRCGVQGVGECSAPLSRLPSYIRAVGGRCDLACAIHKHFMETPHSRDDLSICLVDAVPERLFNKPAVLPALRKRLEFIWIHRLDAGLNKRRFLWHSFTGDIAARVGGPATDEA